MIERVGGSVFQSSTLHRVKNTVCAPIDSISDGDRALTETSNSLVNIGSTLNSLVSDVGGVTKELLAFKGRPFPRPRICSQNFTEAYNGAIRRPIFASFVDPAFHVSIILDGVQEYGDSPGTMKKSLDTHDSAVCKNVDIISGESTSVALQRLHCATSKFKYDYRFLGYNCGGVAHDLLRMSGFNSPTLPNLGIGRDLPVPSAAWEKAKAARADVVHACDEQIHQLYNLFEKFDASEPPSEDHVGYFLSAFESGEMSPDASLYLHVLGTKIPPPRSEGLNTLLEKAAMNAKGYANSLLGESRKYSKKGRKEWRSVLAVIPKPRLEEIRTFIGAETVDRLASGR